MFNLSTNNRIWKQEIFVGENFYVSKLTDFIKENRYNSIFLIYDYNLSKEANILLSSLSEMKISSYSINSKKEKNANIVLSVLQELQFFGAGRNTILIGLGGGFIGDISGVASATYMRGIDYVQIGTTAMSQFDAIIQKVAVNINNVKNIMGAFHSPVLTLCDIKFIYRDDLYFYSFCEVIKHKIIKKQSIKKLNSFLENSLLSKDYKKIIYDSLKVKLSCVVKDPFDLYGVQKKLSLGHTIANVIETTTQLSHGEAVWIGLLAEIQVSLSLNPTSAYLKQLQETLENFIVNSDIQLSKITLKEIDVIKLLKNDKISINNNFSMVLVDESQNVFLKENINIKTIMDSLSKNKYITII